MNDVYMKKGLFISIDGPDGSGKTTLLKSLTKKLTASGFEILTTREPGGTPLAEEVRRILLDPASGSVAPRAEMLLYAAARAQHVVQVIKPALHAGKIVLCDRFTDSSVAYQGFGRGLSLDFIHAVNNLAVENVFPDLTMVLDIEPEEGLRRIIGEGKHLDRLEREKLDFHHRVREGYLKQASDDSQRVKLITAGSRKQVLEAAWNLVEEILKESIIDC